MVYPGGGCTYRFTNISKRIKPETCIEHCKKFGSRKISDWFILAFLLDNTNASEFLFFTVVVLFENN